MFLGSDQVDTLLRIEVRMYLITDMKGGVTKTKAILYSVVTCSMNRLILMKIITAYWFC